MASVPSVEPSSTSTSWKCAYDCASSESSASDRVSGSVAQRHADADERRRMRSPEQRLERPSGLSVPAR